MIEEREGRFNKERFTCKNPECQRFAHKTYNGLCEECEMTRRIKPENEFVGYYEDDEEISTE